ncbi:NADH-quinone oxidoreductase subunit NuoN [Helicobacter burdigaliensis]|uniref:NADH-quinone oxidoreductase subunit NuoN n=1 Tax=Helicobacter burdigaliensis TaxID=2315334 RepID=UPI000EF6DCD7|nr:NADH-quinone oxidoreductase subunit NuoN [Helicobacter burdigaliensis]
MLATPTFSLAELNFVSIVPMLILLVGALIELIVGMCLKNTNKQLYVVLSLIFLGLSLGSLMFVDGVSGVSAFYGMIVIDSFAFLGLVIILLAALLFLPLTLTSKKFHDFSYYEFYALFLFMCAGFAFMVSSTHLIVIFLGLETASLALYTLIAMHNRRTSFESSIKYFVMGALSAAAFAFGAMLLYLATGHLEIGAIWEVLELQESGKNQILLFASMAFFITSLGFKLSLVPFHTWTPDVYEGSNAFLAGFMSIVPKIAGFVVALRILSLFLPNEGVQYLFYALVVITITYPNLVALVQSDVKRMLAYSSISHAGFVFSAILIGEGAYMALFMYWFLFLFANLGAFSMLWVSRTKEQMWDKRYDHPYEKFSGLIKTSPIIAVIMGIFMLSLAGIPPFSVFFGKLEIMRVAISNGYIFLACIMAINSAIAAYYYLKLIVYMFLKEPLVENGELYTQNATLPLKIIMAIAAILSSFAIFYLDTLILIIGSVFYYL